MCHRNWTLSYFTFLSKRLKGENKNIYITPFDGLVFNAQLSSTIYKLSAIYNLSTVLRLNTLGLPQTLFNGHMVDKSLTSQRSAT